MGTVLERQTIENAEKEKHNAMINERYRRLLDAVEDQFASSTETEKAYAPTYAPVALSYAPETTSYDSTPVLEQTPEVKEYLPSALASSLFTAEKFERLEDFRQEEAVAVVAPAQPKAIAKSVTAVAPQYSFTPLAKIAMAVFALVVIAMLTLIGINSQILQRKSIQVKNLEEKKQQLMEENEEIRRYIQELQTEESIIERATEAGLLG